VSFRRSLGRSPINNATRRRVFFTVFYLSIRLFVFQSSTTDGYDGVRRKLSSCRRFVFLSVGRPRVHIQQQRRKMYNSFVRVRVYCFSNDKSSSNNTVALVVREDSSSMILRLVKIVNLPNETGARPNSNVVVQGRAERKIGN